MDILVSQNSFTASLPFILILWSFLKTGTTYLCYVVLAVKDAAFVMVNTSVGLQNNI